MPVRLTQLRLLVWVAHVHLIYVQHFKDIMQIRRTDGELLKKLPKDGAGSSLQDGSDGEGETHVTIVREKCIPVVRGLIALLLSMDFTCNVDLFLITCKVSACSCLCHIVTVSYGLCHIVTVLYGLCHIVVVLYGLCHFVGALSDVCHIVMVSNGLCHFVGALYDRGREIHSPARLGEC